MTSRSELRNRFWESLPELRIVPHGLRAPLAASWLRAAQTEHASIASFGRFALQLLAFGAPSALVEQAHVAALDEIEHARICFALASAYGGERYGPGPLDAVTGELSKDLETIVCGNVEEGCVGETLSALEAEEAARQATDPAVRAALECIAYDEAQHAQLGWSVWGWALAVAPQVKVASELAFEVALAAAHAGLPDDATGNELEPHGRLANRTRRALALRNIDEVLVPAKAKLLAV